MEQDFTISKTAVFKDKKIEEKYYKMYVENNLFFSNKLILFMAINYALFIIYDYFLLNDINLIWQIIFYKIVVLVIVLLVFLNIKKIKNVHLAVAITTISQIVFSISYNQVLMLTKNQDLLMQTLSLMVLITFSFTIPNKWLSLLLISIAYSITFMIVTPFYISDIPTVVYAKAGFYILVTCVLSAAFSYRLNYSRRIQYMKTCELENILKTDCLTGVGNRAKCDSLLIKYKKLFDRYNSVFSVVIFDIDDFKKVNDVHGHFIGDEVLKQIASVSEKNIRVCDSLSRWGGEEFVILFPNTNVEQAYSLTENLRKKIMNEIFINDIKLTCSFGLCEYTMGDDPDKVVKRADSFLYIAKRSGKNIVVMSKDQCLKANI